MSSVTRSLPRCAPRAFRRCHTTPLLPQGDLSGVKRLRRAVVAVVKIPERIELGRRRLLGSRHHEPADVLRAERSPSGSRNTYTSSCRPEGGPPGTPTRPGSSGAWRWPRTGVPRPAGGRRSRRPWFSGADTATGRDVGDSWGQRLTLRGDGAESLSRRHQGRVWHVGAAMQARIAAKNAVPRTNGDSGAQRRARSRIDNLTHR